MGRRDHRPLRRLIAVVAIAAAVATGCGDEDRELVAVETAGPSPVPGDVLWCEPGDIIADLSFTPALPPSVEVLPMDLDEVDLAAATYVRTVFADHPAADAIRTVQYDGGPTGSVVLNWPDVVSGGDGELRPGGWLTVSLIDGEWTISGYTVCNGFAFG